MLLIIADWLCIEHKPTLARKSWVIFSGSLKLNSHIRSVFIELGGHIWKVRWVTLQPVNGLIGMCNDFMVDFHLELELV